MALTDSMTTEEIANSEARYGLHVTPETADWFAGFAAGFKGSKADRAAFDVVAGALRSAYADGNVPDETTGQTLYALYLSLFDDNGVSCEEHMNRVMDVLNKRSGRSKADKSAIAELRDELLGASADMQVRPIPAPLVLSPMTAGPVADVAPVTPVETPDAPAPVADETPDASPEADVTPDAVPAPVVAPVAVPGDVVAGIAVKVGGILNRWSEVTRGIDRMTMAARKAAAADLARDFAECAALQTDADRNGTPLGTLDMEANRIMFAARKILRNAFALLGGSPQYKGDRLTKTQRRTFRRAVAPWRADAARAAL